MQSVYFAWKLFIVSCYWLGLFSTFSSFTWRWIGHIPSWCTISPSNQTEFDLLCFTLFIIYAFSPSKWPNKRPKHSTRHTAARYARKFFSKLAENKKTVENHIPNTSRHNNMIITVIIFLTNLLKISYTIILSIIRQIKYLIRISVTNSNHLKMIDGPTGLVNYFKHYTTNFGRTQVWPKWIFVNGNHVTEIRSMFYLKRRLTMEAKKFWHRKMKNYVSIEKFSIQKKKRLFSAARVLWAIHIWFSVATIIRHARD